MRNFNFREKFFHLPVLTILGRYAVRLYRTAHRLGGIIIKLAACALLKEAQREGEKKNKGKGMGVGKNEERL